MACWCGSRRRLSTAVAGYGSQKGETKSNDHRQLVPWHVSLLCYSQQILLHLIQMVVTNCASWMGHTKCPLSAKNVLSLCGDIHRSEQHEQLALLSMHQSQERRDWHLPFVLYLQWGSCCCQPWPCWHENQVQIRRMETCQSLCPLQQWQKTMIWHKCWLGHIRGPPGSQKEFSSGSDFLPSRDIERRVTRASHFWTLFRMNLMVMAGQAAEVGWLLTEIETVVAAVDEKGALATKDWTKNAKSCLTSLLASSDFCMSESCFFTATAIICFCDLSSFCFFFFDLSSPPSLFYRYSWSLFFYSFVNLLYSFFL